MEVKTEENQHPNAAPKQPGHQEVPSYRELSTIQNIVHWSPGVSLEDLERQCVLAAFRYYRGNKTATAQSLGIAIRTLDNKLEKYQADDKKQKEISDATYNEREEFLKQSRGLPANVAAKPTPAADEFIRQREARRLAREAEGAQPSGSSMRGSQAGVRMEPAREPSAEQSLPMQERKEVQEMPSGHGSANRNRGRR